PAGRRRGRAAWWGASRARETSAAARGRCGGAASRCGSRARRRRLARAGGARGQEPAPAAEARDVARAGHRVWLAQEAGDALALLELEGPHAQRRRHAREEVAEAGARQLPDLDLDRRAVALTA